MTASRREAGHSVQVESDTVQWYRWHCDSCGTEDDGYASLQDAEAAADEHGATA